MTKIRTLQLLTLAASAAAVVVGCQDYHTSTNGALAPEPGPNLVFADTTQPTRDYPQSVAHIQNGDSENDGSIGFRYRSKDNLAGWQYPLVEPAVFAANVVTSPYTLIADQNKQPISSGSQFPPTYTAMPPLPAPNLPVAPEAPTAPEKPSEMTQAELQRELISPRATTAPADVRDAVNQPEKYLVHTTNDPNAPAFTIAGQVVRPGTYDARNAKLSVVVAAAGPSAVDAAKVMVQIDRPGEESATTTLDKLLTGEVEDVMLKNGDVITISVLP